MLTGKMVQARDTYTLMSHNTSNKKYARNTQIVTST